MSHDGNFPPKPPELKVGQRIKQGPNLYEITAINQQGVTVKLIREQVNPHLGNRKFRRKAAKVKAPKPSDDETSMADRLEAIHELPEPEQLSAFGELVAESVDKATDEKTKAAIAAGLKAATCAS